jgi:hypothetical protein
VTVYQGKLWIVDCIEPNDYLLAAILPFCHPFPLRHVATSSVIVHQLITHDLKIALAREGSHNAHRVMIYESRLEHNALKRRKRSLWIVPLGAGRLLTIRLFLKLRDPEGDTVDRCENHDQCLTFT